ncbi:hypothetical protein BX265_4972 [Streptomyces sp. TLI_235]|nr:hypothetical protein [Streptomyces sp. TLI_235]PBC80136.1 hypothetical protein BX265_4972 [Streptomyces sp. TLI_235]
MVNQHSTPTDPWWTRIRPTRIAWHVAMLIVRPAAAAMAGWSLYAVATHYGVPKLLAAVAVAVFDGVALGALYQATEAVKAGRSAAAAILATFAMAGISVRLNVEHARIIGGGLPAMLMFATPAIGLLALSALSWSATRAEARAARGESPMRLPAYGLWGWLLAPQQAAEALQEKARTHVTSGASATHPAASPAVRPRTDRAVLAEKLAAMDPAEAVAITADAHPHLDPAGIAHLLCAYGITVDALQVALLLGRATTPTVHLDRVQPDPAPLPGRDTDQPAIGATMRPDAPTDMPQVGGLPLSEAIVSIHRRLTGDASPKAVVQHLALQGMATDTAYVRTTLSRARTRAMTEAAQEQARRAEAERSNGTGFYP